MSDGRCPTHGMVMDTGMKCPECYRQVWSNVVAAPPGRQPPEPYLNLHFTFPGANPPTNDECKVALAAARRTLGYTLGAWWEASAAPEPRASGAAAPPPNAELAKEFALDLEGWTWELFGTDDPAKLKEKLRVILPAYAWKYRADYEDVRAAAPPAGTQPYCEKCGGPCFACTKPGALATVPAGPGYSLADAVRNIPIPPGLNSIEAEMWDAALSEASALVRAALAGAASPSGTVKHPACPHGFGLACGICGRERRGGPDAER